MGQCRSNGSPTVRAAPTYKTAGSPECPKARAPGLRPAPSSLCWIEYSLHHSLSPAGLPAHNRDEQIGDARGTHLAQFGERLRIGAVEQHHRPAENLPLADRLQFTRGGSLVGMHQHFEITRL